MTTDDFCRQAAMGKRVRPPLQNQPTEAEIGHILAAWEPSGRNRRLLYRVSFLAEDGQRMTVARWAFARVDGIVQMVDLAEG